MLGVPPRGRALDAQGHDALLRELECVRQQVPEDLLQPPRVGPDGGRDARLEEDLVGEPLVVRDLAEAPLRELDDVCHGDLADVDGHRAGLDLREVEDLVDEA